MLTKDQLDHYHEFGYLKLPHFIDEPEVTILRNEVQRMIDSAPVGRDQPVDRMGNAVDHPHDFAFMNLPEDQVAGKKRQILNRISNQCARSEVMRQAYGNPKLLRCVESLYGEDFVPFAESIVIKLPDEGAPFFWHQDGNFKTGPVLERGVNFGIYLYPSTEENGCLRVIPKSHTWGQVDLETMIAEHGERLPDSIPVPAEPGDVLVHSRNLIHGSFTNTSPDMRITVYFGYHARKTVEDVYPTEHIRQRMELIPQAIGARAQSGLYPTEESFVYQPLKNGSSLGAAEQEQSLRTPALGV
ncbi:phytanoyl-CoA dioxygenase family protein [Chloroflexi bacterium TSY]|nr:phytanoyl-CoA dioxygenase family protein [Chloroflexi bacterium TSY]